MDKKTASSKRVFICLPKKHMAALAQNYELDHGLFIKDLNPYINEGYVRAYFKDWGTITGCEVKRNLDSGEDKAVAYVRFSTEDEADRAEWAGPHYIGGDVQVKRVVSPKVDDGLEEKITQAITKRQPLRTLGMGYILEDAQWLDDDFE